MNEMWVTESHGNGLKCWEEGTKYWVVEVIKNVTGQVIELYKLQRIRIPRFLYTLFQFWEILFAWSYAARNLKIPVICA